MVEPVLSVKNLSVALRRSGQHAVVLKDVSFEMGPGEIVGLIGESGSGKSTIGSAIQGLLPATGEPIIRGEIRLCGTELVAAPASMLRYARKHHVRSIGQDPMNALNPTMSIRGQLQEAAISQGSDLQAWLETVGILNSGSVLRSLPHRLSGGQRQRVAIAMAMIADPKLLIADEPTTALDFTLQLKIVELLRAIARQKGAAVLFITHNLALAERVCERIIVIRNGRIVEAGPCKRLLEQPRDDYTREMVKAQKTLEQGERKLLQARYFDREAGNEAVLRMRRVGKRYLGGHSICGRRGGATVLHSFDLEVKRGECVALLGASGSGKSTVIRIAAGLLAVDEGVVSRNEINPPQVVFQDAVASLTPWLTVGEQVGERLRRLRLSSAEMRTRVATVLNEVGLNGALADHLPGKLSVGQCQRIALARAIIVPPSLLLCDEPTSSLDAPLAKTVLDLIDNLRRRLSIGVLFVTHDLAVAAYIADRVAVLNEGRIVEEGDPTSVIENLRSLERSERCSTNVLISPW